MSHEHDNLILDIENLVVRYETEDGIVHALNGIDLQLGYHQTIGLVGETGAGENDRCACHDAARSVASRRR